MLFEKFRLGQNCLPTSSVCAEDLASDERVFLFLIADPFAATSVDVMLRTAVERALSEIVLARRRARDFVCVMDRRRIRHADQSVDNDLFRRADALSCISDMACGYQ